jgi:hypothetical protein
VPKRKSQQATEHVLNKSSACTVELTLKYVSWAALCILEYSTLKTGAVSIDCEYSEAGFLWRGRWQAPKDGNWSHQPRTLCDDEYALDVPTATMASGAANETCLKCKRSSRESYERPGSWHGLVPKKTGIREKKKAPACFRGKLKISPDRILGG